MMTQEKDLHQNQKPKLLAQDQKPMFDSFSLKDLRGLRKDHQQQPDESIISWLDHLWDAAGEATILDGTEARHLGSLSQDPVIDQEIMREASPCSLWDCGENMNRWDGKSTAALAQRVCELKEVKTQRGSSTKREAAPVACSRTARYDDDDMSDPLEGTSKTYAQGKKDNQA
ncbi:hypothetical protein DUI87_04902 [Hirundo rustica rustica]|uniref:Uncharacterized protein n=1 Tax=Hirundo rustica rustica TaxID=333673 RepID=A0A3M0L2P1_HIRRU|nr:hypothetical protein DUI87_04902 [Hirundo rustica rustica]